MTPLEEACLARLRHVGGLRSPGEVGASVIANCPGFGSVAFGGAFAREVKAALTKLRDAGLVAGNGRGSYRALNEPERRAAGYAAQLRGLPRGDEAVKAGGERARRRSLVLDLADLLEGTPAGDDLLKVAEELEGL